MLPIEAQPESRSAGDGAPLPPISHRVWYARPWLMIGLFVGTVALILGVAFALEVYTIKGELESGTFDFSRLSSEYENQISARSDAPASSASPEELVQVSADDDPFLGPVDASVVIIAFEDFECPFCRQAFPEIREVMSAYQDRVKFVYRDFPNTTTHRQALDAALASECADDQGKFWEMHDKLYLNQPAFSKEQLKGYARELGLSATVFNDCFDTQKHLSEIQADTAAGVQAGARGTPTWIVNGIRVQGPISAENWKLIFDSLLSPDTES